MTSVLASELPQTRRGGRAHLGIAILQAGGQRRHGRFASAVPQRLHRRDGVAGPLGQARRERLHGAFVPQRRQHARARAVAGRIARERVEGGLLAIRRERAKRFEAHTLVLRRVHVLPKERGRNAADDRGFLERPLTEPLLVHVEPCGGSRTRELGFNGKDQRRRAARVLREHFFRFGGRLRRHALREKAPAVRDLGGLLETGGGRLRGRFLCCLLREDRGPLNATDKRQMMSVLFGGHSAVSVRRQPRAISRSRSWPSALRATISETAAEVNRR